MIILVSGDDQSAIRNYLKYIRRDYPLENIYEFENEKIDTNEIEEISDTLGIFGNNKLILLAPKKVEQISFKEDYLKDISTHTDLKLVIDAKTISKVTKAYKLLKKFGEEKKFAKSRDYTNFNISDAIYIDRNIKKSIKLISDVENIESDFYGIVSTLQMGLRNYLGYKYNTRYYNKLHPFVKQKTAKAKIDDSRVPDLYSKLYEIDYISKTSSVKKKNLLHDFVLYCLC